MFRTEIDGSVNGMHKDTYCKNHGIPEIGQNMPNNNSNIKMYALHTMQNVNKPKKVPAKTTIGVAMPVSTKLASRKSLHSTESSIPKNITE